MKNGKSLVKLVIELERQSKVKQDFVASTEAMEIKSDGHLSLYSSDDERSFSITDNTHSQIAQRLNIPLKYYQRMRFDAPALLATNVNTWFLEKPERRMIRTLDGKARAFLSDRFSLLLYS